jgi:hypothetical protein
MPVRLTPQRSIRKVHAVVVALVLALALLTGACAAPAASPPAPTAPPPTVAATAVAPTLTAVPPTLAPTALPPTLAPTPDLLPLVAALQSAYNQHDTDALMALLVPEPNWTLGIGMFAQVDGGGVSGAVTAEGVREILDIGFALNSQLEASSCSMKNGTATCDWEIQDDCNPPAASPYHVRAQIGFEAGQIASVYGRWAASDEGAFFPYEAARQEWARANLPDESATYYSYFPTETRGAGVPPGITVSEFGQAVGRICTGYAAVAP